MGRIAYSLKNRPETIRHKTINVHRFVMSRCCSDVDHPQRVSDFANSCTALMYEQTGIYCIVLWKSAFDKSNQTEFVWGPECATQLIAGRDIATRKQDNRNVLYML